MAATHLHNYCINQKEEFIGDDQEPINNFSGTAFEFDAEVPGLMATSVPGTSLIRDLLVEKIAETGLSCPAYNLNRNGSTN